MKKFQSLTIVLLLFSLTVKSQKDGLNSINRNDLKAYMTFFASDELGGREAGSGKNEIAALYIKSNLIRLGLKPIPETMNYLQRIPVLSKEILKEETDLRIKSSSGDVVFSNDSLVYLISPKESAEITGNIVFAGYGYEDSVSGYNDLKDVDLKDKIVVIMTRNPQMADRGEGNMIFDSEIESPKIESVFSQAPKAVLFVYDPKSKFRDAYASGLGKMTSGSIGDKTYSLRLDSGYQEPVMMAFITQYSADKMLVNTGFNLKQMQQKISKDGHPVSTEIKGITVSINTGIEIKEIFMENVIGIVEGSDPVLKNECVIYTAHFDHEGVNNKGEIFNGADDNASGSMALLEVAKAFMNLKNKPLRSIVFVWVNGEEKGMLGSQYYTDNPVIPMEKTLVDINLDMVGRSEMPSDTGKFLGFDLTITRPGEIIAYTAHESTELLTMLASSAREAGITVTDKGKDLPIGSSDHVNFMAKGVPAFLFHSGIHSDLHTIRDDIEKIDFDKMEKVSKLVFLLGFEAADKRNRIKLDKHD
jgi:hypothetical protein